VPQPYKKKLIEVAIPLEAINAASAREKSIRHGHPSTLHLWWARRPLAACRAVLFAQLVDDPSSRVEELMADPKLRARAEAELPGRVAAWEKSKASAQGAAANALEPTLEDVAVEIERKRLFAIIEDLVKWENSTNEEVLERARAEIRQSCGGVLPPVYDPFSGGGSIPLEAQRLGLPAYGSDLNPVAVMIGKAMIEIPPKFKDMPPIHPGIKQRSFYRNAEGLAEDVKYYGEWMRQKAWERIGHLYPQVDLPKEYGGGKATVIAWIWARTVASPDPSMKGAHVPLTTSFVLHAKKGREAIIIPEINKDSCEYIFRLKTGNVSPSELRAAALGTKAGKAQDFICLLSGAPIEREYIREEGRAGRIGRRLIAAVADGGRSAGRIFCVGDEFSGLNSLAEPWGEKAAGFRLEHLSGSTPTRAMITGGVCSAYGLENWGALFDDRQVASLSTFSDLAREVEKFVQEDLDGATRGNTILPEREREDYASSVAAYLAICTSKLTMFLNTLSRWRAGEAKTAPAFGRQGFAMVWDYAEVNPFSGAGGDFFGVVDGAARALAGLSPNSIGEVNQADAQTQSISRNKLISTDPPYYDNISYAVLSDFFYPWLRRSIPKKFAGLFGTLEAPKADELVASAYRHGGTLGAEEFFHFGMKKVMSALADMSLNDVPATIYYAFKQSEVNQDGISSTGWATFLEAVLISGYSVVGTWPVRTESKSRLVAAGSNALANSVVLVCRKKDATADTITRAEFIRALKRELPPAIAELQAANIAPADMPQSAIGPGMGVFSRYTAVLEADDSAMTVKTALQLINAELDEYLGGIQGEFDADTRFAITWFEQNGMGKGDYGVADNLARARGISVDSVKHAGIVESAAGKVRLLKRDELDPDWAPEEDGHLTVWECLQHLVRLHERTGLSLDSAALLKRFGPQAEAVKDLAYCLYDIAANKRREASEATVYNALIADWSELSQMAATVSLEGRNRQMRFEV